MILGGMVTSNHMIVSYGLSIADAAGAAYNMTTTGLGAEFVIWSTTYQESEQNSCDSTNARFRLRPEVSETWYYAYHATREIKYLELSWSAFEKINQYSRTESGFSAIKDVNAVDGGGPSDVQETFVFAEVMRYVWLTLLDDPKATYQVQDSRTGQKNTWVFNTEAHPMRVVSTPK